MDGLLVGNSHDNGGIKIKVPEGQIEAEGGETIINKRSMASQDHIICEGTPKQIASKINEYKGGVQFEPGATCKIISTAPNAANNHNQMNQIKFDRDENYASRNRNAYNFSLKDDKIAANGIVIFNPDTNEFDIDIEDSCGTFTVDPTDAIYRDVHTRVNNDFKPHSDEHYVSTKMAWGGIFSTSKKEADPEMAYQVRKKIKDFSHKVSTIREDYRQGQLTGDEYAGEKAKIINEYSHYISQAPFYDVHVNPSDLMITTSMRGSGYSTKKEKGSDVKSAATDILQSQRAQLKFEAREMDKLFKITSTIDRSYPAWYGKVVDIEKYIAENKDLINKYDPKDNWETSLFKFKLRANEVNVAAERELAARGTIIRSTNPTLRPSPSVSATIYPVGFRMEGNDGNLWEIKADVRGIQRWVKVKEEDGDELAANGMWIQDSIQHPGILRAKAKSMGLIHGDQTLSETDLHKIENLGGKWPKRVQLARTLKSFHKAADGADVKVGTGVFGGNENWRVTSKHTNDIGIFPKHLFTEEQAKQLFKEKYGIAADGIEIYTNGHNIPQGSTELQTGRVENWKTMRAPDGTLFIVVGNNIYTPGDAVLYTKKYNHTDGYETRRAFVGINKGGHIGIVYYTVGAGNIDDHTHFVMPDWEKDVKPLNEATPEDFEHLTEGFANGGPIPVKAGCGCDVAANGKEITYNKKVYNALLQEANENKLWAEKVSKDKEWMANASEVSKDMVNEYLNNSIETIASDNYRYLHYRSHMTSDSGMMKGQHTDRAAKAKWEQLSGETLAEHGKDIQPTTPASKEDISALSNKIITTPYFHRVKMNKESETILFINTSEVKKAIEALVNAGMRKDHIEVTGQYSTNLKFINTHEFNAARRILDIDNQVNREYPKIIVKKAADGMNIGNIKESDIVAGAQFKTADGIVWIIDYVYADKTYGALVKTSMEGGEKGNYKDSIEEVVAFLNEEGAEKIAKDGLEVTDWITGIHLNEYTTKFPDGTLVGWDADFGDMVAYKNKLIPSSDLPEGIKIISIAKASRRKAEYGAAIAPETDTKPMTFEEFSIKLPEIKSPYVGEEGVMYKPKYNTYAGKMSYFKHGRKNLTHFSTAVAYVNYLYDNYGIRFRDLSPEEKKQMFGKFAPMYKLENFKYGGEFKYGQGGPINYYDQKTIDAIRSWDDHGWHYIQPRDVIELAKVAEVYAHDLSDDSEFMISDRTPEELQQIIDSGQYAFFTENKLKHYPHVDIFAKDGLEKYSVSIDYQTTELEPETYTNTVLARDEDEAIVIGESEVKYEKDFLKIQGGSAVKIAADGSVIKKPFNIRVVIDGEDKQSGYDTYDEAKIVFDELVTKYDLSVDSSKDTYAIDNKNEDNWVELYAQGGEVSDLFQNFDINTLDVFERRQYDHFIKQSSKEQTLNILINSVEGDYSQLSPVLAELAKKRDKAESKKKLPKLGNGGVASSPLKTIIFTSKVSRAITIEVYTLPNLQITGILNESKVNFPYSVGQQLPSSHKTWACVNGFFVNNEDPCYSSRPTVSSNGPDNR